MSFKYHQPRTFFPNHSKDRDSEDISILFQQLRSIVLSSDLSEDLWKIIKRAPKTRRILKKLVQEIVPPPATPPQNRQLSQSSPYFTDDNIIASSSSQVHVTSQEAVNPRKRRRSFDEETECYSPLSPKRSRIDMYTRSEQRKHSDPEQNSPISTSVPSPSPAPVRLPIFRGAGSVNKRKRGIYNDAEDHSPQSTKRMRLQPVAGPSNLGLGSQSHSYTNASPSNGENAHLSSDLPHQDSMGYNSYGAQTPEASSSHQAYSAASTSQYCDTPRLRPIVDWTHPAPAPLRSRPPQVFYSHGMHRRSFTPSPTRRLPAAAPIRSPLSVFDSHGMLRSPFSWSPTRRSPRTSELYRRSDEPATPGYSGYLNDSYTRTTDQSSWTSRHSYTPSHAETQRLRSESPLWLSTPPVTPIRSQVVPSSLLFEAHRQQSPSTSVVEKEEEPPLSSPLPLQLRRLFIHPSPPSAAVEEQHHEEQQFIQRSPSFSPSPSPLPIQKKQEFEFLPQYNDSEVERNALLVRAISDASLSYPNDLLEDFIDEVIEEQVMVLAQHDESENIEMDEVEDILLWELGWEEEEEDGWEI